MKQLIILTMMALAPIGTTTIQQQKVGQKVFICTGSSSKKYHAHKNCMGLANCSGEIKQISLNEAVKMKRTPCKICYGK